MAKDRLTGDPQEERTSQVAPTATSIVCTKQKGDSTVHDEYVRLGLLQELVPQGHYTKVTQSSFIPGVSPIPESRREMVDRGKLFDTPAYRWLAANGRLEAEYWVVIQSAGEVPESLMGPK